MSLLFGGGNKVKPQYSGIQVQSSSSNLPLPLVWGMTRLAPNLMWYDDFKAKKKKQKGGKGMGGGATTYTYSASLQMALCLGPITGIARTFKGEEKGASFSSLGFTLFTGTDPQSPWGYLTTAHPANALSYPRTAYLAAANYDLGESAQLPPHSFEVQAVRYNTAPGGKGDADPASVIDDFLTMLVHGTGFPAASVNYNSLNSSAAATTTGDAAFQTYCKAMGFGFSPALSAQAEAAAILEAWATVMNSAMVWDGNQLSFIPYALETVVGNGVTFLPATASVYSLSDRDYISSGKDDPIKVKRSPPEDAFNSLQLEILDRNNEYNPVPVEWKDAGLIDDFGDRPDSMVTAHEVCEPVLAAVMVSLIGQRRAFERNEYTVEVSPRYCLVTPMDLVTLLDPVFGSVQVRVEHVEETDMGTFKWTCKQIMAGSNTSTGFTPATVTNTPNNVAVDPGSVNPPMFIEPPSTLAGDPSVWLAVSGGNGTTFNSKWGGCFVHVSTDGVTYQQIADVQSPARMGKLTGTLAAYGGANPDTVSSAPVNLAMSGGDLATVAAADALAGATLCYVGGEFISFRDATLTSTYNYTLGGQLYRALYGTAAGAHTAGQNFARLDANIVKYVLPASYIGQALHFKFQSYNIFGGGVQALASCTDYMFTPTGTGFGGGAGGAPIATTGVAAVAGAGIASISWTANPTSDNITAYEVWRAPGAGAAFGTATKIATVAGLNYTDLSVTGATYTYFVVPRNVIGAGTASAGVNVSPTAPVAKICRFYGSVDGRPDPAQELFDVNMTGDEVFASGFPSNLGGCDVAPTGAVVFSITKNGAQVGTMNIAAGATTATWTLASGLTFAASDKFGMYAPATQDPTMSRVHYTFVGTRT